MPDLLTITRSAATLPLKLAVLPLRAANRAAEAALGVVNRGERPDSTAREDDRWSVATPPAPPPRRPAPAARRPKPAARRSAPRRPVGPKADRPPPPVRGTEPGLSASEAARRRERLREREADPDGPGATVHVEGTPWPGYERMPVDEILGRLVGAEPPLRAVVRLYEETHDGREAILLATEG